MKTRIKVIVELELEHTEEMPIDVIKQIALNDLHHGGIRGWSSEHGTYRAEEISRKVEI